MDNALSSFLLGLLCTGGLFALSFLLVVGAKMVILTLKERYAKPIQPQPTEERPKPTPVKRRKRKPASIPKPVRSIEIDPEQVDKIYVKKIS